MWLRLKHSLGFESVVTVYILTDTCETEEKVYLQFDSILDQCPCRDALIALGDLNITTGNERDMR